MNLYQCLEEWNLTRWSRDRFAVSNKQMKKQMKHNSVMNSYSKLSPFNKSDSSSANTLLGSLGGIRASRTPAIISDFVSLNSTSELSVVPTVLVIMSTLWVFVGAVEVADNSKIASVEGPGLLLGDRCDLGKPDTDPEDIGVDSREVFGWNTGCLFGSFCNAVTGERENSRSLFLLVLFSWLIDMLIWLDINPFSSNVTELLKFLFGLACSAITERALAPLELSLLSTS